MQGSFYFYSEDRQMSDEPTGFDDCWQSVTASIIPPGSTHTVIPSVQTRGAVATPLVAPPRDVNTTVEVFSLPGLAYSCQEWEVSAAAVTVASAADGNFHYVTSDTNVPGHDISTTVPNVITTAASSQVSYGQEHSDVNCSSNYSAAEYFFTEFLADGELHLLDLNATKAGYAERASTTDNALEIQDRCSNEVTSIGPNDRIGTISELEWIDTCQDSVAPVRDLIIHEPQGSVNQDSHPSTSESSWRQSSALSMGQKKYKFFGKKMPFYNYDNVEDSASYGFYGATVQEHQCHQHNAVVEEAARAAASDNNNFTSVPNSLVAVPNYMIQELQSWQYEREEASRQQIRMPLPDGSTYILADACHDERLSRDERRAKAMKIPMSNEDIINLPIDEFNEKLSKYELTETQISLIRDIRRRGKNKVAAQNCRRRKLDQIVFLQHEVSKLQAERIELGVEHERLRASRVHVRSKYTYLYNLVVQWTQQHLQNSVGQMEEPSSNNGECGSQSETQLGTSMNNKAETKQPIFSLSEQVKDSLNPKGQDHVS